MTDGDNKATSSYSVFEFLKATWSLRGPQTEYYGYSSIVVYITLQNSGSISFAQPLWLVSVFFVDVLSRSCSESVILFPKQFF